MIQPVLGLKIGLIQHILFDRTRKPANRQRAQPIQRQGVIQMIEAMQQNVSRRNFIKGVIATGAAVSSAAYVFRGGALLGQQGHDPFWLDASSKRGRTPVSGLGTSNGVLG